MTLTTPADPTKLDSAWTSRVFNEVLGREKRTPKAVVHDHGTHFAGQFERQLRVLEIDNELTPTGLMPTISETSAR